MGVNNEDHIKKINTQILGWEIQINRKTTIKKEKENDLGKINEHITDNKFYLKLREKKLYKITFPY